MKFTLLLSSILLVSHFSIAQTEDVWDAYIADYNGKPGSTMVNMSLVENAPVKAFGYALITGVTFSNCTPEGFPKSEEFDKLYKLEEAIISLLNMTKANKHAGSFTNECQRLNYFYLKDTNNLRVLLDDFYKIKFPGYKPYISIRPDSQWEGYLKFLYPNEETREYMSNSKVVLKLSERGDSLIAPRQVDHWLYFKTSTDRKAFIEYAKNAGFKVESGRFVKDVSLKYQLQISRMDKVDLSSINKITIELKKEVKKHGGTYDGWETVVVK